VNSVKQYLKRLQDLQIEIIKLAEVERLIFFPDGVKKDRKENDVEHSYILAMSAWYLSQYFPELDKTKVIQYALIHDFVEIHAGDVMAIGRTEEEQALKNKREEEALAKLKQDWPDFTDLTISIEAYEMKDSDEAKFIYALDKIMPVLLNLLSQGKTWKIHDMARDEVINNIRNKVKISTQINELWQPLEDEILSRDEYFNKGKN
jgi:putative hydrolases of HD superfamily